LLLEAVVAVNSTKAVVAVLVDLELQHFLLVLQHRTQ